MGKLSRDKGARFERDVVNFFRDLGIDAKRTAPMQAGNDGDPDVLAGLFLCGEPFGSKRYVWIGVECKHRKTMSVNDQRTWLHEAEMADVDVPILCVRRDREPRMWCLSDDALAALLRGAG